MPITLLHLMLMSKIYVVNSDMKNVIGMSDPNVMFKGPGPLSEIALLEFALKEDSLYFHHKVREPASSLSRLTI